MVCIAAISHGETPCCCIIRVGEHPRSPEDGWIADLHLFIQRRVRDLITEARLLNVDSKAKTKLERFY